MQFRLKQIVAITVGGTLLIEALLPHDGRKQPHIEQGPVEQAPQKQGFAQVGSGSGNVNVQVPAGELKLVGFPPAVVVTRG